MASAWAAGPPGTNAGLLFKVSGMQTGKGGVCRVELRSEVAIVHVIAIGQRGPSAAPHGKPPHRDIPGPPGHTLVWHLRAWATEKWQMGSRSTYVWYVYDLEAPFFPLGLVLVTACLFEHRSQGGFPTRTAQPTGRASRTPGIPLPCIPDGCLGELLVIAEARFSHGGLIHTHRCEIRTIS